MRELAHRYAQALYGEFPQEEPFKAAARQLRECPELWEAMTSPAVRSQEKERVLGRLSFLKDTPELRHFFQVLVRRGRMPLLPEIQREFHSLVLAGQDAAECVMTCVHEPDEEQQKKICQLLCNLHHKSEVRLILRTDPALLGGFTLDIEGVTYDESVRGRLKRLARHLEEVSTP